MNFLFAAPHSYTDRATFLGSVYDACVHILRKAATKIVQFAAEFQPLAVEPWGFRARSRNKIPDILAADSHRLAVCNSDGAIRKRKDVLPLFLLKGVYIKVVPKMRPRISNVRSGSGGKSQQKFGLIRGRPLSA